MNSIPQREQLDIRLGSPETSIFTLACMAREIDPNTKLYLLPSDSGLILAGDTVAVPSFNGLDLHDREILRCTSGYSLLGFDDYWTWNLVNQLVRTDEPKVVIPSNVDSDAAARELAENLTRIRRKAIASTVGIIPMGVAIDFGPSAVATPPLTETTIATSLTAPKAIHINMQIRKLLHLLRDRRIGFETSDELTLIGSRLKRHGSEGAIALLDEIDMIPIPGFTADRLNLAEMIMAKSIDTPRLVTRLRLAATETPYLMHVRNFKDAIVSLAKKLNSSITALTAYKLSLKLA